MSVEIVGGRRDGGCRVRAQVEAVVVEEDVLNVLVEGGLAAHVRCGCLGCGWGHRDSHGDTNVGLGRAAVTLRSEVKVGGTGGGDGLGAVEIDIADAVNVDRRGILTSPVEDDGLAQINRYRVCGDGGRRRSGRSRRGAEGAGINSACLLWQPVTAPSAAKVKAMARILLILLCLAIIRSLLPVVSISKKEHTPLSNSAENYYFQLQLGISAPGPVSARFWVPSASIDIIFMWLALPSAVLA